MRRWFRNWLMLPTTRELEVENKALRIRIHILRDALEQTAWRTRMNMRLPDNQAAHNIAVDAVARDLKQDVRSFGDHHG